MAVEVSVETEAEIDVAVIVVVNNMVYTLVVVSMTVEGAEESDGGND